VNSHIIISGSTRSRLTSVRCARFQRVGTCLIVAFIFAGTGRPSRFSICDGCCSRKASSTSRRRGTSFLTPDISVSTLEIMKHVPVRPIRQRSMSFSLMPPMLSAS